MVLLSQGWCLSGEALPFELYPDACTLVTIVAAVIILFLGAQLKTVITASSVVLG